MKLIRGLVISLPILCLFIPLADGTHFRGGSLSWEPVGDNGSQIEVRYRLGWRLNFEPHDECTEEAIKNGTLVEGEGALTVMKRENEEVIYERIIREPMDYICTDRFEEGFDGDFHWTSGVNSFQLDVTDVTEHAGTEFEIGYFSCCWIGVLNYVRPRRWVMQTRVDLTPRPDNGRINTSPMTSSLPLLRIQQGCEFILEIPYYDKDGDIVQCRWAKYDVETNHYECKPPNCGKPHQMFTITNRSCMIRIDTELADVGWYAVSVMMEDFMNLKDPKPLSSVPFHFLVRVDDGDRKCNDVITAAPERTCLQVTPGEPFTYKATAKTMSPDIPIVNFASVSPQRMEKSNVTLEANGTYSVEYSWVPPPELSGKVETLCYSAFDAERFSGNEVCVELAVGGVHPYLQSAFSVPGLEGKPLSLFDDVWELVYDQKIFVNAEATHLAIIREVPSGNIVLNVTTTHVNRDMEDNILILTFWVPPITLLNENGLYEIEVLPDIVKGVAQCMLPSVGASWLFNTCVPPIPDSHNSIPSSFHDSVLTVLDFNWNITFYQPVNLLPNTSLLAQVLDTEQRVLYNITTEDVILSSALNDTNVISFWTPDWLHLDESTEYVFRVPAGIVVSNSQCNLLSVENLWRFNTSSKFSGGRRPLHELRDPLVSVLCFPTFFEVFVAKSQFAPDMDPAMVTLDEAFCYGVDHNDTHYRLGSTYGQCGTTSVMNGDDTRVSMLNVVKIPSGAYPSYTNRFNPIPHPNYEVHVNCSLSSRRVSFVEINTNVSTVVFHSDAVGNFNFSLKMFPNEEYVSRYRVKDFPIVMEEDQRLYFEARAFSPRRYGPYLQSCVAAPTSLPHDEFQYTFIENGCPLTNTVQFHESPYTTRTRFSIPAEELLNRGLNNYVFVHCDIRLCDRRRNECGARCPTDSNEIPNEISSVLKRSVQSLAVSDEFMDTDGPIIIRRRDQQKNGDDSSPLPWLQLALTCVTAVLCVVCALMILLVMRLKSSLQTSHRAKERMIAPFAISVPSIIPLPENTRT